MGWSHLRTHTHIYKDTDVDLRKLLGHGSDEQLDKLIYSLSSLAATQQSAVIDAVMRWRKLKVEPLDPTIIKRVR